jgi:hypothetical protein
MSKADGMEKSSLPHQRVLRMTMFHSVTFTLKLKPRGRQQRHDGKRNDVIGISVSQRSQCRKQVHASRSEIQVVNGTVKVVPQPIFSPLS